MSESYIAIKYNCCSLVAFYTEKLTERDKFMSPVEAKEFGIVDHVLTRAAITTQDNKNTD